MNAEVLMIGDRIRQKESGLLLQVSEIRPPYIIAVGEYGQFHENSIEPIQLTPEILVANGFKSRELYHFTLYQLGKESFSIAYDLLLKNLCAFTKTVQAGCRLCNTPDKSELSIQIQYVHELQQAMRLIGLRDLADKFVIEKGGPKCQ